MHQARTTDGPAGRLRTFAGSALAILLGRATLGLRTAPVLLGLGAVGVGGGSMIARALPVHDGVADALTDRLLVFLGGHVVDTRGDLVVFGRVAMGGGCALVRGCGRRERVGDIGLRRRTTDLQPLETGAQFFQPRAGVSDRLPDLLDERFPVRHLHRMRR